MIITAHLGHSFSLATCRRRMQPSIFRTMCEAETHTRRGASQRVPIIGRSIDETIMTNEVDIGLPEKLEVVRHGSHVEIVRKWFGWQIVVMTGFAIFWDAFLINWYTQVVPRGDRMAMYFPLVHVAVGIGITYYVVAGWCNRTHIVVGNGNVSVRHRPIPWFGNTKVDASNLRQLYAKEHVTRSRRGGESSSYEVRAVTHDGRNMKLVSGLETSEQALYIEQEIERYLGIKDAPVVGQIG